MKHFGSVRDKPAKRLSFMSNRDQTDDERPVAKRFHVGDVARSVDFIAFHERMASCDELWEHKWMLYTVNEHYAYFVRMPKPSFTYTAISTPYLTVCKVVVLTTMAKSGSTFLARMLQACDAGARNLLVLSEIDAFGAIALRIADFSITIQQARTLLLASLRFA
uniref:Sulfotransferase n=1 Tax=Parascaris equorum TaxID=6256 RepID=A0A914RDY8_PAREQ